MIRVSRVSLKFSNKKKLQQLDSIILEYKRVVNFYIDKLWTEKFLTKFINKEIQDSCTTWLSARLKQCAGKQALQIVKSVKNKKQKLSKAKRKKLTKPEFTKDIIEFDNRFVSFLKLNNSFDEFIKISSIGNKLILLCPFKYHKHLNELIKEGFLRKNSCRLVKKNNQFYVDLFFEKPFERKNPKKTIGIDLGIKKLMVDSDENEYGKNIEKLLEKIKRKKQKSKAYYRALKERDNYINKTVKELPSSDFVLEELKGLHKNTKKRLRKEFRTKLHKWTYAKLISRIENLANKRGSFVFKVDPSYTSQTCTSCGFVHKGNRTGEIFLCRNCGYTADADKNASKNILKRFYPQEFIVSGNTKTNEYNKIT